MIKVTVYLHSGSAPSFEGDDLYVDIRPSDSSLEVKLVQKADKWGLLARFAKDTWEWYKIDYREENK